MKGIIFYYSGSGNTRLVCRYIAARVPQTVFDLYDVQKNTPVDLSRYSLAGFAASAFYWGIPPLMRRFIGRLEKQKDMPAFIFNTFGMMSGRTLKVLEQAVRARGFRVVAGSTLHTPENYPPLISRGWGNEEAPSDQELQRFSAFLSGLQKAADMIREGRVPPVYHARTGFLMSLLPIPARRMALNAVKGLAADRALCKKCGVCVSLCDRKAVSLDPFPVFNRNFCEGCWNCFNHCPEKAIHTDKVSGKYQYKEPLASFKDKFKV